LYRLALSLLVIVLLAIPWAGTRVAGAFFAIGVLPGLAVAPRRSSIDALLGLGAALSPVLFGAFALGAMFAGIQVNGAAWIAAAAGLLLFVAWGGGAPVGSKDDRRALRLAFGLVALAAVMAFALPLSELWWRAREDSWFHAAVAGKLARDGLPVTDPYFAGLRLQYMYFYHAILAACAALARIDYLHAMILVNATALLSCAVAFHALSGLFSRRAGPRVLGTCVWLFAMNGWFYLFFPLRLARALAGQTHGPELLRRFFPWSPSGHETAMSLVSVEGNQFMFLDKFMVGTAFSLTLGLAASLLFLLLSARRGRWSGRSDLAFVLSLAGATLFHPMIGITLAVVTALVLALLLLIRAQPAAGGPSYGRLAGWIALALAATLPYVRSVMPREGTGGASAGFAFQPAVAVGLLSDILPALVFAMLFFRRAGSHRDTPETLGARPFADLSLSASGMLAAWGLLVLVFALAVDLTTNNETKFAYLALLPLAVFAVGGFERAWDSRRARRAALLAVASASLPLHVLYFHHAVRDASVFAVSEQERAVYNWIGKSTPRNAVFIEENDLVRVPVLASRDLYWGNEVYARNWGYPRAEMEARRRLRDAVFSKEGPGEVDIMQLRALGRRVFVIYRMKENDLINAHERFRDTRKFRGRFATTEVAVWEVVLD
jgi:hypothetical protein